MERKKETMDDTLIAHLRESDRTPQTLEAHLLGTAEIARNFCSHVGLKNVGQVLGLLHDFGKASQECQNYLNSAFGIIDPDDKDYVDFDSMQGKIDHSSAGAQYIFQQLNGKGKCENIAAQVLALCIASHHSGLIDCLSPEGEDKFSKRMNKEEESTHFKEISQKIGAFVYEKLENQQVIEKSINELIDKFISIKQIDDDCETLQFKDGLLIRFLLSCLIDADRLNTADFEFPQNAVLRNYSRYIPWNILIQRLNKKLHDFENNPKNEKIDRFRRQVSEACYQSYKKPKGVFQLSVPTGGGKTLASLRFALNHACFHDMERIIYVIPYTSIIDQNADEVRKILEEADPSDGYKGKIVLEHHSNLTPEKETTFQRILAENWDAPIVFTTQVQFFEALFGSGTRNLRRMHQLSNSIIIFDEIQTIPVKCIHMFNKSVQFLVHDCGSSAVLCTATQPLLNRIQPENRALKISEEDQLVPSDLIKSFEISRYQVFDLRKNHGWNDDEICNLVDQELNINGSVLIIVNTKKSARLLYEKLSEKDFCKNIVYHLSTNMCPAHRLRTLSTIKDRLSLKLPVVCVSTQLIEAGVDIDFGSVVRYFAGLDSIIQAAGRCNRHGYRDNGNVLIVNPAEENIERMPDIKKGAESSDRVIREFSKDSKLIEINKTLIDQYYEYYFFDRKNEMNYHVGINSSIGRDDNLFSVLSVNETSQAEYVRINDKKPKIPFKQSFKSAAKNFWVIDSCTRGVIVPFTDEGKNIITNLCGSHYRGNEFQILRDAQRYSVNLFEFEFEKLNQNSAIFETQKYSGIFYLDAQYYSYQTGLNLNPINPMENYFS